jgi:xanthine/CO dehydrogenase XdhC/CoxF family maturation factor
MLKEDNAAYFAKRAEQEFQELQDCVAGTHRHSKDFKADFLLESSQVFYWLALRAVIQHKSFEEFLVAQAEGLARLEKIHAENEILLSEIFEKDLRECGEKGYLCEVIGYRD